MGFPHPSAGGLGSGQENNLKSRERNRRTAPRKGLKLHFQTQNTPKLKRAEEIFGPRKGN
jgi:hypothetical protein